jgi:hypothetical protein
MRIGSENVTGRTVRGTVVTNAAAERTGIRAALGTLLGIVLSGPLAVAVVATTHPQPTWRDAELFAVSYHGMQLLPYAGGIVLVGALVVLISSIHAFAPDEHRASTNAALVFTAAFAALILFNYVVQTTFVPALVSRYDESNAPLLAALTMSNPTSLAWGIEMWGWASFGLATWLVAPVFRGGRLERATAFAFGANGPVSIAGALWTVVRPGWVMTPAGLAAFACWNVLLAVMVALAWVTLRRRRRGAREPRPTFTMVESPG